MSFNSNNYNSCSTDKGTVTTAIAEVAEDIKSPLNYSSGTKFKNCSTANTWTVRGLKSFTAATTCIESLPFKHQNSSTWCMVLTRDSDGLYLSFLLKDSPTEMLLRANVRADEILRTGEKREVFPSTWYNLDEGEKTEMLPVRKTETAGEGDDEDEITLQCEVCIQCIVQDELPVVNTTEVQADVVRGLYEMLLKEVHTDFELHAGDTVLKAHRALLSVRSPYFADMLQPDTKEAQEGFAQVSDVKPEVLKQVLLYMYTGVAPALKDMSWDLLKAADKYQLRQLKRQCEAHIASCLNVENAAETAANASVFSCDMLWDRAVLFIKRNLSEVMCTPGWTEAGATHPEAIQRINELME
ncbi:speckle-type POZ protein-like [Schistocerca piceifrons]|uniref:speckle-type POZ protein-like n=1 Tax=Schistocerca piceifrons TaxID=274613 RepID=UPI001F5F6D18|nr:speckle-type POZ protein-like [Schistocerca piceifrons]XP_047099575.1 speckle-type POZ protein-like [Schistocerca piceifrons]